MTAPPLSTSVFSHKGDVLVVFNQPVSRLTFTPEDAEKIAQGILEAVKTARAEAEPIDKGRKPS